METKKKKKADIYRYRGLFINIGLVVSLFLVTSAFHMKFYQGDICVLPTVESNIDTLVFIPPTLHPPPPKPKPIVQPQVIEVPDEVIPDDIGGYIFEPDTFEDILVLEEEEEEEAETIYEFGIEKHPSPVGGMEAFNEFLRKHLKYPKRARKMRVEGKVFIQFVVDKDGSLTDIKVLKGIGAGCDEESVRVLSKHPRWHAGEQRGRPVKVRMVVPVFFRLQ